MEFKGIEKENEGKTFAYPRKMKNFSLPDGMKVSGRYFYKSYGHDWILDTFKKKVCLKYIPTEKDRNKCCCGRTITEHGPGEFITEEKINKNSICKWHHTNYCKEVKTNAFGEIEFLGSGKKTRAKYIRLSDGTNPVDSLKLLRKVWNLDYPQLLISVTGGAKSFKMSPKMKAHFTNGLLKVCQTTCTWVVTGGTNTGVMKHVGEALQSSTAANVYRIGVATWGIVNKREKLIKGEDGRPVNYHVGTSYNTPGASLDNNHTHFLLVDDGRINKYGGEIAFRGKLERAICNMNIEKNRAERNVPGVQVVLEGGPNTISTVVAALSQDPPMPVVVVKGSGRAADLLAEAYKLSCGEGPLFDVGDVAEHRLLLNKIERVFEGMDSSEHNKIYRNLLKCIEKKDLITIHKMEDENVQIDDAILKAFMKGKHVRPFDQLDLAMLWNRLDLAKEIFNGEIIWKMEHLYTSMYNALRRNRPEFVELLLENGVIIGKFLTVYRLEALFNYRYEESDNILKLVFDKTKTNSSGRTIKLEDVSRVLKKLTGGIHICNEEYGRSDTILNLAVMTGDKVTFTNPFNELLIWAVLCNMKEMATMLWTHGEEPIAKALVARKLYQGMATIALKSHKQDDIIVAFENESKKFGMLAIHLLNEAYKVDEKLAGQLVTYSLSNWGEETCLSLAVASKHLEFVAHPCCQDLLSVKWTGEIMFIGPQFYQVFFAFIFPPLVLLFKYKPLKEYSLVLMTEREHDQIEEGVKEEKQLSKKTKSNHSEDDKEKIKGKNRIEEISLNVSLESIDLISSFNNSGTYTFSSNEHIVKQSRDKTLYQKIVSFYKAPVTKFVANVIAYCFFLILYMCVITTKLQPQPLPSEWFLVCIVFSYATEELRQLLQSEQDSLVKKFWEWASNYWNMCDAFAIVFFFVGFGFRINDETRVIGHVIYAVDIIFWILRFLDIFAVNQHIGPYIVMIWKMTIDMINFLLILLVFMVAYGVSRYAILNPEKERSWETIGEIFFVPYFQIFGELFLEYPRENGTTIFKTKVNSYQHIEGLVTVIMAFYLLIANILLVNLLIAIFNNTYTTVKANSKVIWKFQRYQLITEYSTRPILVPPFSIIINIYQLIIALCRCCKVKRVDRKLKAFLSRDQLHDVTLFEERCLTNFLRQKNAIMHATQEEKLRVISERVDGISSMMENYTIDDIAGGSVSQRNKWIVGRLDSLEQLMSRLETQLRDITNIIVKKPKPLQIPAYFGGCPLSTGKTSDTGLFPNVNNERRGFIKKIAVDFRKLSLKKKCMRSKSMVPEMIDGKIKEEFQEMKSRQRRITLPSVESSKLLTDKLESQSKIQSSNESINEDVEISSSDTEGFDCVDGLDAISPRHISDYEILEENSTDFNLTGKEFADLSDLEFGTNFTDINVADGDVDTIATNSKNNDIEVNKTGEKGRFIHCWSRCPVYPFSSVERCFVSDKFVDWKKMMPDYKPVVYVSPTVSSCLPWVDPDPTNEKFDLIKFNENDGTIIRKSFHGNYDVLNGLPRNPWGRTGIADRGLLCRYGPNHIQKVLFTKLRSKSRKNSTSCRLEILLVVQKSGKISIPGGSCDSSNRLPVELMHLFSKNTLDYLGMGTEMIKHYMDKIEQIINNRKIISENYMDDERNTDNAWIEVSVCTYHDNDGDIIDRFIQNDLSSMKYCPEKQYEWRDATEETAYLLQNERSRALLLEWLHYVTDYNNAEFQPFAK